MEAMNGAQLSEAIRRKAGEFRRLCDGIDEATASRAPSGRWSPKEIVSHLSGAEGGGFMTSIKAFLDAGHPGGRAAPRADPAFRQARPHVFCSAPRRVRQGIRRPRRVCLRPLAATASEKGPCGGPQGVPDRRVSNPRSLSPGYRGEPHHLPHRSYAGDTPGSREADKGVSAAFGGAGISGFSLPVPGYRFGAGREERTHPS